MNDLCACASLYSLIWNRSAHITPTPDVLVRLTEVRFFINQVKRDIEPKILAK